MSIFPFLLLPEDVQAQAALPEYREMAYDFEHNCLKKRAGKYYLVTQNEALKIWIYKALQTRRFVYQAYSAHYGTEIDNVLGVSANREIIESEIRRYITETIMVNPYIQELSNFVYNWQTKAACLVTFDVATIYDKMTYNSEVYVT